jgi:hypothetical protein
MDEHTENRVKQEYNRPLRDKRGLFLPGYTANPNGRPKKENTFSDIARALLSSKSIDITYTFPKDGEIVTSKMQITSDNTFNHALAVALIKEGMGGNVQAIKELVDRTEGKVSDSMRIGSLDKPETPLTDEQKADIAHKLNLKVNENAAND